MSLGLQFAIEGRLYGLDIQDVPRVIHMVKLQPVPGMPEYFQGLLNLEGKNIPVIDLAMRLGIRKKKEYSLNTPIIICADKNNRVGLIVDEVFDVTRYDPSQTQLANLDGDGNNSFISGSIQSANGDVLLLNTKNMYFHTNK